MYGNGFGFTRDYVSSLVAGRYAMFNGELGIVSTRM